MLHTTLHTRQLCCLFLPSSPSSLGQGGAALHLAVRHRLSQVVQYLCEHGVDLKQLDGEGNSAVWAALRSGQMDMAKCLVGVNRDSGSVSGLLLGSLHVPVCRWSTAVTPTPGPQDQRGACSPCCTGPSYSGTHSRPYSLLGMGQT